MRRPRWPSSRATCPSSGEDEVDAIIERAIDQADATSMAQMGQVMKVAQQEIAGRADGALVAGKVKARLTS